MIGCYTAQSGKPIEKVYGIEAPKYLLFINRVNNFEKEKVKKENFGRATAEKNKENIQAVQNSIARCYSRIKWKMLSHSPYSPNLAPSDFFLLSKLKDLLKETSVTSINQTKNTTNIWFKRRLITSLEGLEYFKHY